MTNHEGEPVLTDDEMRAEFAALFPHGWGGGDVMGELAPGGWVACQLVAVQHPSAEQVHEELTRMRQNIADLTGHGAGEPPRRPSRALMKSRAVPSNRGGSARNWSAAAYGTYFQTTTR